MIGLEFKHLLDVQFALNTVLGNRELLVEDDVERGDVRASLARPTRRVAALPLLLAAVHARSRIGACPVSWAQRSTATST